MVAEMMELAGDIPFWTWEKAREAYLVELDLTTGEQTFASTTTIEFTCASPGASTFADLVGAEVHEITLNGRPLDPATAYVDSRIALDDLDAEYARCVARALEP